MSYPVPANYYPNPSYLSPARTSSYYLIAQYWESPCYGPGRGQWFVAPVLNGQQASYWGPAPGPIFQHLDPKQRYYILSQEDLGRLRSEVPVVPSLADIQRSFAAAPAAPRPASIAAATPNANLNGTNPTPEGWPQLPSPSPPAMPSANCMDTAKSFFKSKSKSGSRSKGLSIPPPAGPSPGPAPAPAPRARARRGPLDRPGLAVCREYVYHNSGSIEEYSSDDEGLDSGREPNLITLDESLIMHYSYQYSSSPPAPLIFCSQPYISPSYWEEEAEARRREAEGRRREGEARRREAEGRRREADARRREGDVRRREGDARRREADARRREADARRREAQATGREPETIFREAWGTRGPEYSVPAFGMDRGASYSHGPPPAAAPSGGGAFQNQWYGLENGMRFTLDTSSDTVVRGSEVEMKGPGRVHVFKGDKHIETLECTSPAVISSGASSQLILVCT
ncbi:hypothetical protein DFP72DRAFT_1104882 [Ephemerocybe angulata]|uniref:Uncharacterized protein n=1 Tax=Ephemerocybe angulata TaxID=980116 RepID=A0A8H6HBB6_9AGAR|nr:hypothetical protein DFP72DRAFT_1104882 [Tulosesus angulatus]